MKGRRQKSQCEAGALDINTLGAGPEVRNRTVLHGSTSSLVCGRERVLVYQSDLNQTVYPSVRLYAKPGNTDGTGHIITEQ